MHLTLFFSFTVAFIIEGLVDGISNSLKKDLTFSSKTSDSADFYISKIVGKEKNLVVIGTAGDKFIEFDGPEAKLVQMKNDDSSTNLSTVKRIKLTPQDYNSFGSMISVTKSKLSYHQIITKLGKCYGISNESTLGLVDCDDIRSYLILKDSDTEDGTLQTLETDLSQSPVHVSRNYDKAGDKTSNKVDEKKNDKVGDRTSDKVDEKTNDKVTNRTAEKGADKVDTQNTQLVVIRHGENGKDLFVTNTPNGINVSIPNSEQQQMINSMQDKLEQMAINNKDELQKENTPSNSADNSEENENMKLTTHKKHKKPTEEWMHKRSTKHRRVRHPAMLHSSTHKKPIIAPGNVLSGVTPANISIGQPKGTLQPPVYQPSIGQPQDTLQPPVYQPQATPQPPVYQPSIGQPQDTLQVYLPSAPQATPQSSVYQPQASTGQPPGYQPQASTGQPLFYQPHPSTGQPQGTPQVYLPSAPQDTPQSPGYQPQPSTGQPQGTPQPTLQPLVYQPQPSTGQPPVYQPQATPQSPGYQPQPSTLQPQGTPQPTLQMYLDSALLAYLHPKGQQLQKEPTVIQNPPTPLYYSIPPNAQISSLNQPVLGIEPLGSPQMMPTTNNLNFQPPYTGYENPSSPNVNTNEESESLFKYIKNSIQKKLDEEHINRKRSRNHGR